MLHVLVGSNADDFDTVVDACIRHHGAACAVCGFSYGETYGPEFDGLIVVHHLNPISTDGDPHDVDPIADLRPVCADCHLVIHRRPTPFTIEEVREMMANASAGPGEVGG
jgi:5-methylcytosine-specific restriction protein A